MQAFCPAPMPLKPPTPDRMDLYEADSFSFSYTRNSSPKHSSDSFLPPHSGPQTFVCGSLLFLEPVQGVRRTVQTIVTPRVRYVLNFQQQPSILQSIGTQGILKKVHHIIFFVLIRNAGKRSCSGKTNSASGANSGNLRLDKAFVTAACPIRA